MPRKGNQTGRKGGRKAPQQQRRRQQPRQYNRKTGKQTMIGPMTKAATTSLSASRYAACLMHPFSPLAEGACYPEPFAAMTTTRKVRYELAVQPTATGNFDLCIQPHVYFSAFSGQGTITGAPVSVAPANLPSGCNYFGAIPASAWGSYYKSYRIVGYGVRIKSNVDFTKSGGRIYVAVTPASQQLPATLVAGCTASSFYDCFDVPHEALAGGSGRIISSSIVGLPRGHQLAVSELMSANGVEVTFPIVSAAATHFLESNNNGSEQGLLTLGAAAGTVQSPGISMGYASANGHSQLLLRGVGINTDVSSALVVEVLYHVEGIPNPISGLSSVVESVRKLPPAMPHEISNVLHAAGSVPAVQYVSEKMKAGASAWGNRAKAALASRAGKEAEKLLGVGMKTLMLV